MALAPPYICPGCDQPCPFPTQCLEALEPGKPESEVVVTCGCGTQHLLTRASGAVVRVPSGVTVDPTWHAKRDVRDREARLAEHAADVALAESRKAAGQCVHCGAAKAVA